MITLTIKQKQQLSEHPILRDEQSEQLKKDIAFKTAFMFDIERTYKEQNQILNNYFGGY